MDPVLTFIVVAIIAFLGLSLWWQSGAKKTRVTVVPIAEHHVADVVNRSFNGLMWRDVQGPGHINKQRRAIQNAGPVISVDIEPTGDGGTLVSTWMSGAHTQFGFVTYSLAALQQMKRLLKRVEGAAALVPPNTVPLGLDTHEGASNPDEHQGVRLRTQSGGVPMSDLTPEERELTGAVVQKVREVDWNGDITPFIDAIVSVIDGLVAQDPKFTEFAEAIHDQAVSWSLAAWSEDLVENIADSGWTQLSDRLKPFIPAT